MRRTQLYLDDQLWNTLHSRARSQKTTISELVRAAVRECYLGNQEERAKAMTGFVGIRKSRTDLIPTNKIIRELRHGNRLDRLSKNNS